MIDDIKIDKGISNIKFEPNKILEKTYPTVYKKEDVSLTNELGKLVNLLALDESTSSESARLVSENARVLAAKNLVQSNQYVIDYSRLAEKLMNNGLLDAVDNQ